MENKWKSEYIPLKSLVLWDDNPRTFDKNFPNPDQKEIISRYSSDKLLRIARNILKYQKEDLQPGEFTVVKKGTRYVVFDGNRRLSAYKILLNPDLATEKKDKFIEFSKEFIFDGNKKLRFNIAPDIKSALLRIDDLHNDNFHENWNPTAQTNFALLNIDGQIKTLKQKKVHLKRDSLYKKIKFFHFNKKIKEIVDNPNKFKVTSLERIVDSTVGKKYLNYDFNEKGEIIIRGDEDRFNKILKTVAEDVALGNADSRKQQTNDLKEDYFKKTLKKLGLIDEKEDKETRKAVGTISKKDWVTFEEYKNYDSSHGADRVKDILKELYRVTPKNGDNTNLLAISLRVVIELAVYSKLKHKSKISKIIYDEKTRRANEGKELPKNWTPGLKEMLKYVLDEADSLSVDTQDKKTISKVMKDRKDFIESLDLFIHDVTYHPTETQVREIWKSFGRPIFEIISKI